MLSLQGRLPARRYITLAVFFLLAIILWQGFNPSRLPFKSPSGSSIDYVPSTIDWSQAKIYFPPNKTVPLPSGRPKTLPRVQARAASEDNHDTSKSRREAVRKAFVKSWNAYKQYAWGKDELMPLSGKGKTTFSGWSAQLVDALDSLWILGLKDDFRHAVREVAKINWSKTDGSKINVFEVTIRYLGGLLSAYDLSGEEVLLKKAVELGDALYMAFDTPNRLPTHWLSYTKAENGETLGDTSISGAASGSLCVEFTRLSQITGDAKYYDATERVKQFFYENQNHTKAPGLWPWDMNFREGTIKDGFFTFGAGADSQYEYLPKMHALLGGLDPEYVEMTILSLDAGRDKLLFKPMTPKDEDILMSGNLDTFTGKRESTAQMQHLTCFVGGMYALAGKLVGRNDYVDLAARLTAGCVWGYDSFPTNIMPEGTELVKCENMDQPCPYEQDRFSAGSSKNLPGGFLRINDGRYMLRPEGIESVFYMWRVTGDPVWRDAAWRMWEGIVKETETELAFASIQDASMHGSAKLDSMETFWLAETTKYFFLTFEDEDVINLDEWVFNTEAHPMRRPIGSLSLRAGKSTRHDLTTRRHPALTTHDSNVLPSSPPNRPPTFTQHTTTEKNTNKKKDQDRNRDEARGMPLRLAAGRALAAQPLTLHGASPTAHLRRFHASLTRASDFAKQNHYERLGIHHDASPGEIKKLSSPPPPPPPSFPRPKDKTQKANQKQNNNPQVLLLALQVAPPGREPLARRRPKLLPPLRSLQRPLRRLPRQAHEESTATSTASSARGDPWKHFHQAPGGMGPGSSPFGAGRPDDDVPHFDRRAHARTHQRQDERRYERRRALGDDDVEFEPQTSLAGHFFIIMGILAATMVAPLVYLQFMRLGRRNRDGV
ncbi:glycoside hydrolase family 47 protein [Metarhizium robertsii ARSEF 23]|uniref:alpha-1,2-Mannosidase n=2 Tax=Metarhizium robertsii TaxID=568076 RepID=E9EZX1_METRA|nr:glycoside hydrolase family 47 protein [Metarhizium robertsii ARSEF 23]EFY99512.1 glycoside hydrolase family 47 protein [Metarhizium robertsii ARSEF 23]